ncbi:MAG TPA: xanthine dehydrogenase family protein subunit M [bacterium]|nr:xanthine dehydrogenase family protein subunit M [bacterium]HEV2356109.1 xanthine dehydrogenase family protein subunit M [bacterium]
MIPAPFEYHSPSTVQEAIGLLERHGDEAKVLAGGHSLLPIMKFRLAQPKVVVDIGRIPGLDKIEVRGSTIAIGALATHDAVEESDVLRTRCPLLPETASVIGDMQVRNRGTIGGSLAHADPAADYPGAILALEAEIVAAGPKGTRTIPARDFFVEMLTTALAPNEIITEIRVPVTGKAAAYLKHPHPASGYAVVGVAVVLQMSGGKVQQAAIGLNGVAGKAYRASAVEQALRGKTLDEQTVAAAAARAADGVDVQADLYASSEFRAHLASVYTKRAVLKAASRAT